MITELLRKNTITDQLKEDHERFRGLFSQYESGDQNVRQTVAAEFMRLIAIHDQVEKKLLYPNANEVSPEAEEIVMRSKEAHHVVNFLLLELKAMPFGPRFDAKFFKLIEGLQSHMTEEENELFPLVEASDMDIKGLGEQMVQLKKRLSAGGVIGRAASRGVGTLLAAGVVAGLGYLWYRSGKYSVDDVKEAVGIGGNGRAHNGRRH
jgi:uncharacterized protein YdcH (DUF465 family)